MTQKQYLQYNLWVGCGRENVLHYYGPLKYLLMGVQILDVHTAISKPIKFDYWLI